MADSSDSEQLNEDQHKNKEENNSNLELHRKGTNYQSFSNIDRDGIEPEPQIIDLHEEPPLNNDKNKSRTPWARNEKNPDFNLVLINGANKDFKSWMTIDEGSYLIKEFVSKMVENNRISGICQNKSFLGDIMTQIQNKLHRDGKQLIVTTFHNG